MKKVVFAILAVMLVLVPVSAQSNFALGLNLGTNMGVGFQFQMKDFDLVGNVGYSLVDAKHLSVDAAASYKVADFAISKAQFDVTAGIGGYVNIPFSDQASLGAAVLVPVGVKYSLANKNVPLDFILRLSPGLRILPDLGFGFGGNLAILWRF